MTAAVHRLRRRELRLAWCWCVLYTSLAPRPARRRRRVEILGHLWESEQAGHPPRAVLAASVRGMPDDLGWACSAVFGVAGRLLRVPMTFVACALLFVLQAWGASAVEPTTVAKPFELAGVVGGVAMLAVAAALSLAGRRRP